MNNLELDNEVSAKIDAAIRAADTKTVNALVSVINFLISDAFDASDEESMWIGYHLSKALKPLSSVTPNVLLGAVRRELNTGDYSQRLFNRVPSKEALMVPVNGVTYGLLDDWVEVISEIILSSYPDARPMIRSSIIGSVHGLLTELGLTNNQKNCRPSTYLPNSIRYLLNTKR